MPSPWVGCKIRSPLNRSLEHSYVHMVICEHVCTGVPALQTTSTSSVREHPAVRSHVNEFLFPKILWQYSGMFLHVPKTIFQEFSLMNCCGKCGPRSLKKDCCYSRDIRCEVALLANLSTTFRLGVGFFCRPLKTRIVGPQTENFA